MKQLSLFATAILMMFSCTQVADTSSKEMDEVAKQNKELIKKMVQAYENEDNAVLAEIYSDSLESVGPMHGDVWPKDSIMASNMDWFEIADSIDFDVHVILHETLEEGDLAGDWVLLWATVSWYSVKAEKSFVVDLHAPHLVVDGKIVYEHSYWNQWDAFKQAGAKLVWPEAE